MSVKSDLITAKLNLKFMHNNKKESLAMNDNDLRKIAEFTAEMITENMKDVKPPAHVCPFNPETVTALNSLGAYFIGFEKAFKGFIVICIVVGVIAAFLIGLKSKAVEFWNYIK